MAVKIYHGDILFTPAADRMEIHENSYYSRRWCGFRFVKNPGNI